jgi:hypothetical protein
MITIEGTFEENPAPKKGGVRKASIRPKDTNHYRQFCRYALGAGRSFLTVWEIDFLNGIQKIVGQDTVRLSKKQRDKIAAIERKVLDGEPMVILEGDAIESMRRLIRFASGDGHLSAAAENFLVMKLKPVMHEPMISLSRKQWHFYREIQERVCFERGGKPEPIDPDGLVENDDPDGWPARNIYAEHEAERFAQLHLDDDDDGY